MKSIFFSVIIALVLSGCTLIEGERAGIQIKSDTQSNVSVNGEQKGATPVTLEDLKPGDYEIALSNDEGSWNKTIRVENGTLFYVNYNVAPTEELEEGEMIYLEKDGRGVGIISTPGQAEVTLDGEKQGFTPYLIQNISEGEHTIVLTKDGYKSREIKINGIKDHKIMVEAKLKSLSASSETEQPVASASPTSSASPTASASTRASATPRTSPSPTSSARASASASPRATATPRASATASPSASPRATSSSTSVKGTVTVLETSTGWLRVRDKAGLEGKEIAKINTGDTVDYTQQTDSGWTEIILTDGQKGYVASRFVKVNN